MINRKKNDLSRALLAVERIESARFVGPTAAQIISATLTDQAGEISALEKKLEEKTFYLKRAEEFRDYWGSLVCQLLEMDMEDLDFQVIDGVDIERLTQKALGCFLALDAKVLAATKMAGAFQQARAPLNIKQFDIHLNLTIDTRVETPPSRFEPNAVFCGYGPAKPARGSN